MPRTKVVAQSESNTENIKPNAVKLDNDVIDAYLKAVDDEVARVDLKLENEKKRIMLILRTSLKEHSLKFPHSNCKTIAELKFDKPEAATIIDISSFKNVTANSTRNLHKGKNLNYTDESRNTSLKPKTLSTIKKAKTTRLSRSLSRSKLQQAVSTMSSYNTPAHGISNTTFGVVTPKVKPNTPQVLLRRPKQGEMALSMQGSPLMVGSISTDQKANVNIPLLDGRVLTIQPQRGLRTSQIPNLDEETQRQIETLRDNLNKVCAFVARK